MRISEIFGRTLRQGPKFIDPLSEFAMRSALVRILEGRNYFLPLGVNIMQQIETCYLTAGPKSQRVLLPPVIAKGDWEEILDFEIQSYRQLPISLMAGRLIQSTETPAGFARPKWARALQWVFAAGTDDQLIPLEKEWTYGMQTAWSKMGLAPQKVEFKSNSHAWVHLSDHGSEDLLYCPSCGFHALRAFARFKREEPQKEPLEEVHQIETPGLNTIEALADYLEIPESRTLKAVFLQTSTADLVLAVLPGDLDVSLAKVAHAIDEASLEPAEESVIRNAGIEPGYGGPVGIAANTCKEPGGAIVIADQAVEDGVNFVTGANRADFHLGGVNYPRDFSVTFLADIAKAAEGDGCPECDENLEAGRAILLACQQGLRRPFQYNTADGQELLGLVSEGTVLLDATMTALIDVHADDVGIGWPKSLAPFDVYLVALKSPNEVGAAYTALEKAGFRVLLDDRKVSAGVKFTDADLIGCPLRVTVSQRSLKEGGVEISLRGGENQEIIPISALGEAAKARLESIM
jgi:prolyl-tRNA synthetase